MYIASPFLHAALAAALCAAVAPAPADKIVFTSMSADGKTVGVFVLNADGSRTPLSKEGALEFDPALSPDGKHIAFVVGAKTDHSGDVWVMGADGTGRKQLTQNKAKTMAIAPAWSPDGKQVLYTRTAVTNEPPKDAELMLIDAEGKTEKSLGKGMMAVWSPPDGKQILYTGLEKGKDFEPRLWLMDADGANPKRLFNTPSMMGAYSPDGKRIAYMGAATTNPDTPPRIQVCDADGSNAVEASKTNAGFELAPRWSADGKRLYFNRTQNPGDKKASIFVMDADGGNEKELTKGEGMDLLGGAAMFLMERMVEAPKP